jgi:hypothetical protein
MERFDSSQLHLFDDKPYFVHEFKFPNVYELPRRLEANQGHDNTFDFTQDDVEADTVRALIFNLPRRIIPPDEAA